MNLVQLPALNHRNANTTATAVDLSWRSTGAARLLNGNDRRRANHREKTRNLRLGHVHLKIRDLNRSVPFYTRMLGLRLTEWVGRYAFLSSGSEHHSIALEEIGDWAINPPRRAVGVAHIAFQVPDRATFSGMQEKLRDARVPFISRNNGTSWASTFKDPDGNDIEIYVDRRYSPGGSKLWKSRWYGPLKSEAGRTRGSLFVETGHKRLSDSSLKISPGRSKPTTRRSRATHMGASTVRAALR